jgi:hypothetical protein
MLVLLLANLYYFWLLVVAGLPSAIDVCDVPMVSAAVAEWFSCEFLLLLLVSLLNVAVFSTVANCPTVCSGGPAADDILDVPIVPAAAVISDFNSVPDVVDLGYWTQKNYPYVYTWYTGLNSDRLPKNTWPLAIIGMPPSINFPAHSAIP